MRLITNFDCTCFRGRHGLDPKRASRSHGRLSDAAGGPQQLLHECGHNVDRHCIADNATHGTVAQQALVLQAVGVCTLEAHELLASLMTVICMIALPTPANNPSKSDGAAMEHDTMICPPIAYRIGCLLMPLMFIVHYCVSFTVVHDGGGPSQ